MKKVKKGPIVAIILIIIAIIILLQFVYIVREDEQVVLIRLGTMIGSVNAGDQDEAGLHFKAPWVSANIYTKKIMRWDGEPDLIATRPYKQHILIDTTARWRIKDPEQFYRKLKGDFTEAAGRLDDSIDSAARNIIRGSFFIQVVSSQEEKIGQVIKDSLEIPSELTKEQFQKDFIEKFEDQDGNILPEFEDEAEFVKSVYEKPDKNDGRYKLKENITKKEKDDLLEIMKFTHYNIPMGSRMKGRNQLENEILSIVKDKILTDFGIEILDVIIKRVDYNDQNRQSAYDRMVAERNKVATEKRSIGLKRKQEIEGETEEFRRTEISKAYEEAQTLRGEGDAEAAKIYAEAYTDSPQDRALGLPSKEEFYEFYKLLQAYNQLSRNSDLTLSTDSDFFKMFKDMNARIGK